MQTQNMNMLTHVHEDMTVYDNNGNKVGTVKAVQLGDEDLARPGVETMTAQAAPAATEHTLANEIAEAIRAHDRQPDELRAQFKRYGYLTVNAGLLRADRYVRADQIAAVNEDRVQLNASQDELLKN